MPERSGVITMKGGPLTLVGHEVKVGDIAPDFTAIDTNLAPVRVLSFHGKACILSSVVSLDTPVCDTETKRFNDEAARLGPDITILTLSMDLPFAQKRWCGAAGVTKVQTLSDYRDASFGNAYGVLIKELRLLARAVFLVDKKGIVRHAEIVPEITSEPDYASLLGELKKISAAP